MKASSVSIPLLLLLGLMVALLGYAQVDYSTATLSGTVFDAQEASVAGATVTVTNPATGITKTVKTGPDGTYQVPTLVPGTYGVQVDAQGFAKSVAKNVQLTLGQIVIYDAHLQLGSVYTVIEVTENAAPMIQVEQTQQANTINEIQQQDLPNVTRHFTEQIYTLPGVANSETARSQNASLFVGFHTTGFSIGGSNGRSNLITIDGGEDDYGSGELRTENVPVGSIQELQVNRNAFGAEFGFTAGTAINMITKSGTNQFHGSVYVYFRDQHTEARSYFDTLPSKPFDQSVIPGFTFGGPIVKGKLFFFTSYEYQKIDTPRFRSYLTSPAAQGIAGFPGQITNGIPDQKYYIDTQLANSPLGMAVPTLAPGLAGALSPLFNRNTVTLLTNNTGIFDDPARNNDWVTRIDYQPDPNDAISVRFNLMHDFNYYPGIGDDPAVSPSSGFRLHAEDYTLLMTWNHIFTPQVVNQLTVQVVPSSPAVETALEPNTPFLTIGGFGNFQQNFGLPYAAYQHRYQLEDNVTWVLGKHTVKFGGSYRPDHYKVDNHIWFGGQYDFQSGTYPIFLLLPAAVQGAFCQFNAALGVNFYQPFPLPSGTPAACTTPGPRGAAAGFPIGPASTNITAVEAFSLGLPQDTRQGFGNPVWQDWAQYLGLYAQDSWKFSPKLTLNYGGRVDLDVEPAPYNRNIYFSPRLGFAWDPWGNHKTIVRGGSGIFVAPIPFLLPYTTNLLGSSGGYINEIATVGAQSIGLWATNQGPGKLPFSVINSAAALGITPGPGAPNNVIFGAMPDFKNTYAVEASLSIARELTNNLSLEVAYTMYHGVHLTLVHETAYQEVLGAPIDPFSGPQYQLTAAATAKNLIQDNTNSSIGSSIYHGGTVSLTKRYSSNIQFQANYTFSKAIDDTVDFNVQFAAFSPSRLNRERGLSSFNITHNFVANAVYNTSSQAGYGHGFFSRAIADITVSPIVSLRSGVPFSILVPGLQNGTQGHGFYARPWHAGRNTGVGPNFYDFDLRLAKAFYIRRDAGLRLELIADGTNLLNHTNFSNVNNIFPANPNFVLPNGGTLLNGPYNLHGIKGLPVSDPLAFTDANPQRRIQFGLALAF